MKLKYYLRGLGIGIAVTAIIMSFIRQPEKLTDAQIKLRAHELGMVEKSVLADFQEDDEKLSEKEEVKNEVSQEGTLQEEMTDVGEDSEVKNEKEDTAVESTLVSEENTVVNLAENEEVTENIKENEAVTGNQEEEQVATEEQIVTEEQEMIKQPEKLEEGSEGNVTVVGSFSESTVPISNDIPKDEVVENYVVIFLESGYSSEYASKKIKEAGLVDSWLEFNRYMVRNGLDRKIRAGNHEIPVGASMEEIARILCRQE